ncbi:4-amino-4-deoxychorismate lyase [Maribacter sedimenticola]|uniref:4-amino-4-deoxychorismate lyase n=1 Tax=Maribacter sedimenticola TaxID=228956 RepID=A0ABY1SL35_9FLAO|nr:aminotransferase class IV [Maribacter sedimenticola]SNR73468.1 4-amino-4-deoxychorismate lyase [Maribacter sedimenticola]
MYPLFESVHIGNGQIKNAVYHEKRFASSYFAYFNNRPAYSLFENVSLPELDLDINYKLRIAYGLKDKKWQITPYTNSLPSTLQLVYDDTITYPHKFTDREHLNSLYQNRKNADDVLIICKGQITDTSYCNILFTDGSTIFTPSTPLLKGTCRARLLAENNIQTKLITPADIQDYRHFQLINALNDFDASRWMPIKNIYQPK